ncbi:protein chain elongation factor ef-tu [Flammeovirgaceae bacterium 311]|nr:protein chain elongation factor ef-tu [Flammeovirgaceae bacterium 311]
MIQTFTYRTEVGDREYQHTIYAKDVESSINKWLTNIEDLKNQVYSFDPISVDKIVAQFSNNRINLQKSGQLHYLTYFIDEKPQVTYIDTVRKTAPDFVARLDYLTTEAGGRKGYAASGYRPHFQIEGLNVLTSAEQIFIDKDKVYPGETVTAEIRILSTDTFAGLLYEGMDFKLAEVVRVVATGKILEVLNEKLKITSK